MGYHITEWGGYKDGEEGRLGLILLHGPDPLHGPICACTSNISGAGPSWPTGLTSFTPEQGTNIPLQQRGLWRPKLPCRIQQVLCWSWCIAMQGVAEDWAANQYVSHFIVGLQIQHPLSPGAIPGSRCLYHIKAWDIVKHPLSLKDHKIPSFIGVTMKDAEWSVLQGSTPSKKRRRKSIFQNYSTLLNTFTEK